MTDDIDFFESVVALPLCDHVAGVYVDTGGWSLDADPASPYHGTWVHAHPKCMKPRHLKERAA